MITFNDWKQPNIQVVKHFANAFDINYYRAEQHLSNIFSSQPLNTLIDEIIPSRVTTLNAHYHTRLHGNTTKAIIEYLKQHGPELEQKLRDSNFPDYSIAGAIASCEGHNNFSFATKYCSFVNPDVYPIFDNQVCRVLNFFQRRDGFYKNRWLRLEDVRQECDYQEFVKIIDAYKAHYKLGSCTYREIDKFLWLVGVNVGSFAELEKECDAP